MAPSPTLRTFTNIEATYQPFPGYNRKYLEAGQVLPDDQYPRIGDFA